MTDELCSEQAATSEPAGARPPVPLAFNSDASAMLEQIKEGYAADPLYAAGQASARARYGLELNDDGLYLVGSAVAVPKVAELKRYLIRELHCSPYAGHPGVKRTQTLISRYFFWPGMRGDINDFVSGCLPCQRNKAVSGPKAGKLLPLPVPNAIWDDISMDFVGPLPKTARGHDAVLVVVDRLSKMAHFLPCTTDITGPGVAELFCKEIFRLHGLPSSIVTDRGTQFLNEFNGAVLRIVGTQHCVTSAFHPESDGQTERVNRVLCEMLRHFVNKQYNDWDEHLPLAEFAHNNAHSTATDCTPFFACYGKHPRTPMSIVHDRAAQRQLPRDAREQFVADRMAIVQSVKQAMAAAQARMLKQTDAKRRELTFKVGDQVSLKTKHLGLSTLPSRKLFPRYIGPFEITRVVNPAAYTLRRTWRAHNTFHVSLLRPFKHNGEAVEPMSFTLVGGADEEWQVEHVTDFNPKILKPSGAHRRVREVDFTVKWLGLAAGVDAVQPWHNLKGTCDAALQALATAWSLPADIFLRGNNLLPSTDDMIPPAPPRR